MKRFLVIAASVTVLVVAACTAKNPPSSVTKPTTVTANATATATATNEATEEPTAEATAAAECETFWWRVWEREKAGEYSLACDLNLDGTDDVITYENNDEQYNSVLMVNSETYQLDVHSLNYIVLHDFDPDDACIDLLVSGDEASGDYVTYVFRYDGAALTLLDTQYGILEMMGQGDTRTSVSLVQQADVLGTWGGSRAYTLIDGKLHADDEIWKNTVAFTIERCLTVTRELPVTIDGAAATLPVGTKLMPTTMAVDGSWATVQTEEGVIATVTFTRMEDQWEPLINDTPESNYFETVPYAG